MWEDCEIESIKRIACAPLPDVRRKVKRINSGAYGTIRVMVDYIGRYRECSAGNDILESRWALGAIDPRKIVFVKL